MATATACNDDVMISLVLAGLHALQRDAAVYCYDGLGLVQLGRLQPACMHLSPLACCRHSAYKTCRGMRCRWAFTDCDQRAGL